MNLSTEYMGLKLKNPIIVSSSKITDEIIDIKKCIDVGAGAIVLKSLFEEQMVANSEVLMDQDIKYFWFPEAIEQINKYSKEYGLNKVLELISQIKDYSDVPVIASINCITSHTWPQFAKSLEDAGADGIELNIALLPFDKSTPGKEIEDQYVKIVTEVKKYVSIPVAVKLSNYFTNLIQITHRLDDAGVNGLVLFNRLYRPDIDIEKEVIVHDNVLSAPEEMTKSLRWVALLSHQLNCQVAGATGIHDYKDVVKQLLAGASAVQICSTLYKNGLSYIDTILTDLEKWMSRHHYDTIDQFRSKICKENECSIMFERIQFLKKDM